MDHHLRHAIRHTGNNFRLLDEKQISEIKIRVLIILENHEKNEEIKRMINSAKEYPINKDNLEMRFIDKNNTLQFNKNYYETKNILGKDIYIDGLSESIRSKIPSYTDRICLGAFLEGVDKQNIKAVDNWFEDYRKRLFNDYGAHMVWFENNVISNYSPINKSWLNKLMINDINEVIQEIKHSNNKIDKLPDLENISNSLKNLRMIKSEELSEIDLKQNKDYKIFLEEFNKIKNYFSSYGRQDLKLNNKFKIK